MINATPVFYTPLPDITSGWTLFLDRDGIINKEIIGGYVLSFDAFQLEEGALDALKILQHYFSRIFVVSNQRGVGKNLMTQSDLDIITDRMQSAIHNYGGRIDEVFYATSVNTDDEMRKPNKGMALLAKSKHPEISFSKSIMVGNMPSDMQFGRNIGAYTVYVPTRSEETPLQENVDASCKSLLAFAQAIQNR